MDRERILSKIAELEGYLEELRTILPKDFEEFQKIEKKRACERLLQIAIEAVMDICYLLVRDLRLGLPSDEEDILDKIEEAGIIQGELQETLRKMRGFRNILVHEYGRVDDWIVYQMTTQGFESFDRFRKTVLRFLYSG
ncbi:MAG: hypothetical protein PWP60_1083 [Candidatus Atribacteria bacterium]|uniref:DUF86 domain-containing protein n=1 Tax=Thermatribacter velox TaxID=3039681 RepID=A0ABZ2YA53_9BACT|nr:hypothetical protein [Candidatus Atribacteria bacterium]